MSDLQSEIFGFIIVAIVVIGLGLFTKKKEDEYNKMMEETKEEEN